MGRAISVYVIYNPFEWDKHQIEYELKHDDDVEAQIHAGYTNDNWYIDMINADEVWLFGNCKMIPAAMIAKMIPLDVWQMG